MRIRSIKPEWLQDERMVLASSDARVLSIALILMADDYGNGRAHPRLLSGQVFPGESSEKLQCAMRELCGWFTELYEIDGQQYYHIRNWDKHQRIEKRSKYGKVPPPSPNTTGTLPEDSPTIPGGLPEDSRNTPCRIMDHGSWITDHGSDARASDSWTELSPESLVLSAYRDAFERETNAPWMSHDAVRREAGVVARWLVEFCKLRDRKIPEVATELIEGYFRDAWAREHEWPWGPLAKSPTKYLGAQAVSKREDTELELRALIQRRSEAAERGDEALRQQIHKQIQALKGGQRAVNA